MTVIDALQTMNFVLCFQYHQHSAQGAAQARHLGSSMWGEERHAQCISVAPGGVEPATLWTHVCFLSAMVFCGILFKVLCIIVVVEV